MESLLDILIFLIFGVFAGFCGGFFGIGGGTVIVPIMLNFGIDIKEAVGISILQMLFSSAFGSFVNFKNKNLKLNSGIYLGLGGFCGGLFSGFIVSVVPGGLLKYGLLIALLTAIIKFFKTDVTSLDNEVANWLLFVLGFVVGAFAISMGIGGALFLTPILVGFLGVDIKKAVSMGLFFVMFSAISGFISLAYNGLINYQAGIILGVASLFGVYIGTNLSYKIDKNSQKKWLLGLYIAMFLLTLKEVILR